MQFEQGLPQHFIVFAQTPKAQEQSRRIFLQFGVALALPTVGILLGGASILGAFFLTLFLIIPGFNLVALDDDYTIFGYFTDEKVLNSHLRRVMSLLNQSLALRDAHNQVEDDMEEARSRESMNYGLLDRDWPEELELEDAVGPIVKKLRGQE